MITAKGGVGPRPVQRRAGAGYDADAAPDQRSTTANGPRSTTELVREPV
jgi:hypothetical protein